MAKEHKDLDAIPRSTIAFESKYPDLDKWLNGKPWELTPGEDFAVKPMTFYSAVKGWAKKKNLKVDVSIQGSTVWIQKV